MSLNRITSLAAVLSLFCFTWSSGAVQPCAGVLATQEAPANISFGIAAPVRNIINSGNISIPQLSQLIRNRVSGLIPEYSATANNRFSFISSIDEGERYKVVIAKESELKWVLVWITPSNNAMERKYFTALGSDVEAKVYQLKRRVKGYDKLRVDGAVQLKLKQKHNLTVEQVIESMATWNGKYYENTDPRMMGRGSFKIFGTLQGRENAIRIIMFIENGQAVLITAF